MENTLLVNNNNNIIGQELFERFIIAGIEFDDCLTRFTIVDKSSNKIKLKTIYRLYGSKNINNSSYCYLMYIIYYIDEHTFREYNITLEIEEWNDRLTTYGKHLLGGYYLYYPLTGNLIWKEGIFNINMGVI